ncbi:MAG TPA: hypothetical protein VIN09_01950 [Chloroflexota bacterium]
MRRAASTAPLFGAAFVVGRGVAGLLVGDGLSLARVLGGLMGAVAGGTVAFLLLRGRRLTR